MAMTRQEQRAKRQRQRTQRQRERQRQRTRRQKARQENRSRRAEGRQAVRMERVKQKGQSGFFTPEGIRARGDVASGLIGQGVDIAGIATGGTLGGSILSQIGGRREKQTDTLLENGSMMIQDSMSTSGFPMNGGGALTTPEDDKPFYTKPLFIGTAVIGGFLIFQQLRK